MMTDDNMKVSFLVYLFVINITMRKQLWDFDRDKEQQTIKLTKVSKILKTRSIFQAFCQYVTLVMEISKHVSAAEMSAEIFRKDILFSFLRNSNIALLSMQMVF